MELTRRKFMTAVAAGVATALAGPKFNGVDLYYNGKPMFRTVPPLYPYQRDALRYMGIDPARIGADRSVICMARQIGKTIRVEQMIEFFKLEDPERITQQIRRYS